MVRFEVIVINVGIVFFSKLYSIGDEGVLGRVVDEGGFFKDIGNSEDS